MLPNPHHSINLMTVPPRSKFAPRRGPDPSVDISTLTVELERVLELSNRSFKSNYILEQLRGASGPSLHASME